MIVRSVFMVWVPSGYGRAAILWFKDVTTPLAHLENMMTPPQTTDKRQGGWTSHWNCPSTAFGSDILRGVVFLLICVISRIQPIASVDLYSHHKVQQHNQKPSLANSEDIITCVKGGNLRVDWVERAVPEDRVRFCAFDDLLCVVQHEHAEQHEASVHRHGVQSRA